MKTENTRIFGANLRNMSRRRLLLLTAFVVTALVLSNYLVQRQYDRLDKQINSIYQDRLMPSHYLFQLQTLLLNKKLMQEHGELKGEISQRELTRYDENIDSIVADYEKTYLTEEETKEWKILRNALARYEDLESALTLANDASETTLLSQRIEAQFREALSSL